jgi:hypothetical protein
VDGRDDLNAAGLTVVLDWNAKQYDFLHCTEPFQNLEGGVRAGKSFVLCWKAFNYVCQYPGICIALTRYTQDGLDAILKPVWREVLRAACVVTQWNSEEQCDEFPNGPDPMDPYAGGSRVYLRALKSSEETQRYSKLAGLTLSILAIDQAEELPEDIYRHYVPARLSQPGFPKQVWITPNPPMPNSWIAHEWPEGQQKPKHALIQTSMFDNVDVLGQEYIDLNLAAYEPGTLEYRRLVEGKRGLIVAGKPVYARHFNAKRHLQTGLRVIPELPIYESVDFGTRHPCAVWGQLPPGGRLHILGGLMASDLSLEEFIPEINDTRAEWFGDVPMLQWTCDPAGNARNPHGSKTGVQILQEWGIYPRIEPDANHPPQKQYSVDTVIGYLRRSDGDGKPLFALNPQFKIVSPQGVRHEAVLQQVFEGGYCYDPKRTYQGTSYPHLTPFLKDGWFEHSANALDYLILAFAPRDAAEQAGLVRNPAAERRAKEALRATGRTVTEKGVRELQAQIVKAAAEQEAAKLRARALRDAQRDDDPFTWDGSDSRRSGQRRDYFLSRRPSDRGSIPPSRGGYR